MNLDKISENILLPAAQRDAIAFNIIRLDPFQRHACTSYKYVSDLKGLWQAAVAANAAYPKKDPQLLTLPASKLALEAAKKQSSTRFNRFSDFYSDSFGLPDRSLSAARKPATDIQENALVTLAVQLLDSWQMDEE